MPNPNRLPFAVSAKQISRAYLDACKEAANAPSSIGSRTLKRKTVPPFARPDAVLKREIYTLSCHLVGHRHWPRLLEKHVRHRDEEHVVRLPEANVMEWVIRLVNWHPVHARSAFAPHEKVPLLGKEPLSHLRTELNFAYWYAIEPIFVVPFIYLVGGYEVISARSAHDGYPLFDEDWLRKMQFRHGLSHQQLREAERIHFGADDENDNDAAPISKRPPPKVDEDEWPDD